jgi:glycerol-3-phosphate dehydrogenase
LANQQKLIMTKETNTLQHRGAPPGKRHGDGGVFYAGDWLDIEDCAGTFTNNCDACEYDSPCPRSQSRNATSTSSTDMALYDVVIIGAGCIGGAVARELSRYELRILWLEAADDVSQGATKGNSGIVHSGYDDEPGTNRAKFCWPGNQMFAQLDKELHFGYQMNGSLVVAFTANDMEHLHELQKRGETNGVQHLKMIGQEELRQLEPHISKDAIGALYSPTAGNVIPYVSSS